MGLATMKPVYYFGFGAIALIIAACAQSAGAPQPDAPDLLHRSIKALSDQQVADLKAGRGMGLALAAELNGYPGPTHALELADKIALSQNQRSRTETLLAAMNGETVPIGEEVIALEGALDKQFAEKTVTPQSLDSATAAIGAANARLRSTHLKYHLAMLEILDPAQVSAYTHLRGYAAGGAAFDHHHHSP